ncbi:NADP-dependent oxidoreductase domain-containing protein [Mycena belliarum]|uniref:NADP-dependent oxidoreductase domain-containing protein n=1 Tax=Mycena belliarum TaxID=1033014 RepID=A0AAD6XT11_9AGAR|nr:NADP-dependent oxidoreductase domain-containing protein [Mycena belliae]
MSVTLNDQSKIPVIGFGTGTAFYGRDCANSIKLAIECGFTHLDGAQIYANEQFLGAGIRAAGKARSELYIVTKLKMPSGAAQVKASLVESLQKLGVEYVDLFLIHSPRPLAPEDNLPKLWQAMEAVHAEGLAKSIGVSNFTVDDLMAIVPGAKTIPSVNQIELHPYVWKAAEPIVKFCLEHGITPASYGGLTPLVRAAGGPVDEVLPPIVERLSKANNKPVTSAQVLGKWILQKGAIIVTTSSKENRIREYLETAKVPDLEAEEIEAIDAAAAPFHKRVFMRQVFGE